MQLAELNNHLQGTGDFLYVC